MQIIQVPRGVTPLLSSAQDQTKVKQSYQDGGQDNYPGLTSVSGVNQRTRFWRRPCITQYQWPSKKHVRLALSKCTLNLWVSTESNRRSSSNRNNQRNSLPPVSGHPAARCLFTSYFHTPHVKLAYHVPLAAARKTDSTSICETPPAVKYLALTSVVVTIQDAPFMCPRCFSGHSTSQYAWDLNTPYTYEGHQFKRDGYQNRKATDSNICILGPWTYLNYKHTQQWLKNGN